MEGGTVRPQNKSAATDERSISELVKALTEQTQTLARKEVELAKAELTQKGKRLGVGAGAFGAAGLLGLFAFGALTATLILLLGTAIDAWVAALIVTVVYALIAGALALTGKKQVEEGTPPVPERAMASSKEDVETAKRSVQEARHD
jgi:lipopolysaccharide export LptBFGC system permease protein LptF